MTETKRLLDAYLSHGTQAASLARLVLEKEREIKVLAHKAKLELFALKLELFALQYTHAMRWRDFPVSEEVAS